MPYAVSSPPLKVPELESVSRSSLLPTSHLGCATLHTLSKRQDTHSGWVSSVPVHGSKSDFRKPIAVLIYSRFFCSFWVTNKCVKIHLKKPTKQHGEFLKDYTSTSNYFTGSCKLRLGHIKNFKVFYRVKACFTLVIGAFQKRLSSIL